MTLFNLTGGARFSDDDVVKIVILCLLLLFYFVVVVVIVVADDDCCSIPFFSFNPTRLNKEFSTSMVVISNSRPTTQFLKLRSESLKTPLSNSQMSR